jgi:hypothetical protein
MGPIFQKNKEFAQMNIVQEIEILITDFIRQIIICQGGKIKGVQ